MRQFLKRLIPACAIGAIIGIAAAAWQDQSELEPSSSFRTDHFTFELFDELTIDDVEQLAYFFESRHERVLADMDLKKANTATIRIWGDQMKFLEQMKQSVGASEPLIRVYSPSTDTIHILLAESVSRTNWKNGNASVLS